MPPTGTSYIMFTKIAAIPPTGSVHGYITRLQFRVPVPTEQPLLSQHSGRANIRSPSIGSGDGSAGITLRSINVCLGMTFVGPFVRPPSSSLIFKVYNLFIRTIFQTLAPDDHHSPSDTKYCQFAHAVPNSDHDAEIQ